VALAAAEQECTFGQLYVSEFNSTTVRIFDLNGNLAALKEEGSIVVGGGPEINLDVSASATVVASIYRGTAAKGFTDGAAMWIDTAVYKEEHGDHFHVETGTPSLISNAAFNCSRPIHYTRHDKKIAIFCDGSYDANPQVNTTVWVVDEDKFKMSGENAIVFSTTIQGTHHGVAVPVDDNHVMHSLALPERIRRNSTNSLPSTFQIVDYKGNVLHSLTNTSNKDMSCAGFHGSWAIDNTFVLACDANHGGFLVVNYDPTGKTYKSRALLYPSAYAMGHRTGSFAEDHKSPYVVGNFASSNQSHLMAFKPTDTVLTTANVQTLPLRQCAYAFEQTEAKLVLVFLPNGVLHAFTVDPWTEVAKKQVVPNMTSCTQAMFTAGYMHGFVLHYTSKTVYSIDLRDAMKGNMKVTNAPLSFTPFSAVVAGVPDGTACESDFKAPTPAAAPLKTPVAAPVTAPVAMPFTALAPVVAPKATPVAAPVTAPMVAPVVTPMAAPFVAPMMAPLVAPTKPAGRRGRCGLLRMSLICPRTGCGLIGRLLGMCD
jgi:hypothetical protein